MDFDRINPVALISGATHGAGAACAQPIAYGADGGLILIDRAAAALDALADTLGAQGVAPERVSMLAHDDAEDPQWWARVGAFIKDQYGRLDWAVINACAPPLDDGALVDLRRDGAAQMESAALALRTVIPLMRFNSAGGAIVVIAPAATLKPDPGLLQFIRASAKDAAEDHIRINAIALGQTPGAIQSFEDIARDTGSERAAFEIIANLTPPLARYTGDGDLNRLLLALLTDAAPVTGTTLVVDGGYTL